MVQFGAFWGFRRAFLTNENPFCQNNVDSAAFSRIGSYAPDLAHKTTCVQKDVWVFHALQLNIDYKVQESMVFRGNM